MKGTREGERAILDREQKKRSTVNSWVWCGKEDSGKAQASENPVGRASEHLHRLDGWGLLREAGNVSEATS